MPWSNKSWCAMQRRIVSRVDRIVSSEYGSFRVHHAQRPGLFHPLSLYPASCLSFASTSDHTCQGRSPSHQEDDNCFTTWRIKGFGCRTDARLAHRLPRRHHPCSGERSVAAEMIGVWRRDCSWSVANIVLSLCTNMLLYSKETYIYFHASLLCIYLKRDFSKAMVQVTISCVPVALTFGTLYGRL